MEKSITLQVGVKIFLKNSDGRYLLLKRSPSRYPDIKNFWDIPGGRIKAGSTLFENLKREVFEETKLSVSGEPKLIGAQDIIRLPEKHIVRLTFSANVSGEPSTLPQSVPEHGRKVLGEPILDEEHLEYKWTTLDEMKKIKELDEFTREILEKNFLSS